MVQRRGYSEWVKLVEEFEKSASSLEDFSAKLGVKPSTLQFWFYKLRKQASRASRFLPVNVVASAAPKARQGATETVELALATGALLRFSVGTDVRYVAQIIAALG
jgi:transposase-like protein